MKFYFTFFALCSTWIITAQNYKYPMASPRQTVTQQFSITSISVDYSRPGVRERKIFGELVPYGKIWRAGANEATSIKFGQDVLFGGKPTKSGTYAIFITPQEKEWTVVLNYDADAWGAYSYDPNENAIEIKVPVETQKTLQERLEYSFEDMTENKVNLIIKWEYVKVAIPIEVDKLENVNKIIQHLTEIKQLERDMGN
ncbi:DUF2911 domain-containing protein [Capnocytophaga canimorsus]|uniref:DUF2911 domain-containing protein n=1 Tax=Capnocytophaga canimorsus TaxID=28188 RepID=UPI0037D67B2A